ncbi:16488_t:CDS:2 [Entrophospora sp. SA101]|nr:16488_t:CDS:2 [Entrophospora sp. SA101]CAJ0845801.1 4341_t:CDS:2 [Entrophospora sp. SA101]
MLSLSPKAKDELVIELRKRTQRKDSISAPGSTKELILYAKEAVESAKELKKELEIELAKSETKIQELEEKQVLFEEQETKINYLELRVQELTNLIKTQKQKIIQDFLNVLPEKELIQQLITTYLEFKKAEKQGSPSRKLKKECNKIEDVLEERQGEDFVDKLQPILKEQKQTLKQITYNKEEKAIVEKHEKTSQEQNKNYQELKLELAEMKGQIAIIKDRPTQQFIISGTNQQVSTGNNAIFNNQTQYNIQYQQLAKDVEEKTNEILTNQEITPQEQKAINQVILFLGTKELFINYRQAVLNKLIDCYCRLANKSKSTKLTTFNSMMGITSKIAKAIPGGEVAETSMGIIGDTINLTGTLIQEKNLKNIAEPSRVTMETIKILALVKDKPYPFSADHDVFKVGEIWESNLLNLSLEELKTFLEKLDKSLESFKQGFQEQRTQLAEQSWFKAIEKQTDLLKEQTQD